MLPGMCGMSSTASWNAKPVMSSALSAGSPAQMPNAGSRVRVRYTLRTADGDLVEECGEGNELEFVVDEGAPLAACVTCVMACTSWWSRCRHSLVLSRCMHGVNGVSVLSHAVALRMMQEAHCFSTACCA